MPKEKEATQEVALFGQQSGDAVVNYGEAQGLGNQNVGADDLAIPRIVLVQSNSAAINDGLEGARPGLFQNTITNEFFESLYIVPLMYEMNFTVWKKRDLGGGIQGTFSSLKEASEHVETLQGGEEAHDIVETAKHALLVVDENGKARHAAIMHFSATQLTASRQWNSAIQMEHPEGAPRFACVWRISAEKRSNSKGTWFVPKFDMMGQCGQELFDAAYKFYQSVTSAAEAA